MSASAVERRAAGQLEQVEVELGSAEDIVRIRREVRRLAERAGFSLVNVTKVVTAASELARNTYEHGGGGDARIAIIDAGGRRGLQLIFEDQGPGIPDIDRALADGFTTGGGLGLGLGGSRRLLSELEIHSVVGEGTRVFGVRWS